MFMLWLVAYSAPSNNKTNNQLILSSKGIVKFESKFAPFENIGLSV